MWHRAQRQEPTPRAGGFFLVIAILAGTITGLIVGQPSAGFLVGIGTGLLILGTMWWSDRRRG